MDPSSTLILKRSDVRALLQLGDCIRVVEDAFRLHAAGTVPPPAVLAYHVSDGGFHVKAAGLGASRPFFAAKVNANFPGNPARYGLPTIQGIVALYHSETGIPLALMDSMEITVLRTAAATAVAASYLARSDADIATICGCGAQGMAQLEAIHQVRPLKRAFAVDADAHRSEEFAGAMSERLGIEVRAGNGLAEAARASSIVVTCTPSRTAILTRADVSPGAFVAGVGADNPEKQELSADLMATSKVVVDHLDQCLSIGDLHHAVASGAMTAAQVHATLGDVILGSKPGREAPGEVIVFDSTGTALQDVAAAVLVYERAIAAGAGLKVFLGA